MGVSGRSVSELLLRQGFEVTATDLGSREQFNGALDLLEEKGCRLVLGTHRMEDFLGADRIIVSPGVPLTIEPLLAAARKGVEIVGELDWAWRQIDVPVVAVSGTNGKTTTTSLIGEMIRASGKKVFVGGNIGTPLSQWVLDGGDAEIMVLEVSSFQLDTAAQFCPDVGVLLNITEDHLDRYESFSAYADSKLSLFSRQNRSHTAIVNVDDPICRQRMGEIPGRVLTASRTDANAHAAIHGWELRVEAEGVAPFSLSLENCLLKGIHNEENILAAVLAVTVMGVAPQTMQRVLDGYRGLPHRVEWVRTWKGIDFYDDSKGTNVGAVVKALESFDRPVLLLLGGRDKLGAYAPIAESMKGRGKGCFVFGEAAPRIQKELEGSTPTLSFSNLEEAFKAATEKAAEGDAVLLSPACSSFDQYRSYAQRGDHFKSLVARLPEQIQSCKV
jgi:UDP-N-acetylmuramoylalanine--D-glutamate ligase